MKARDRTIVVDASNTILGRLATYVAKLLQEGYKVHVVNAEKALLSGDPHMVIESYKIWLELKTLRNPQRMSPKRPRSPIGIVKRAVKGMLPKHNWKGIIAMKNLKVYVGFPEELKRREVLRIKNAEGSRLSGRYITVGEVAKALGWKG